MSDEANPPTSELEAKRARARQLLEQRHRERSWPLSSAQERLWFLDRAEPGSTQYNVPCAVELRGRLDRGALERSLAAIVERHPLLRSRVRETDGVPRLVLADQPCALQVVELVSSTSSDDSSLDAELRRRLEQAAARPFDLPTGPLARFTLLACGPTRAVLLVEVHHLAFDAVSLGLFIEELGALYRRATGGGGPELAPLPLAYGDYAAWQKAWLAGEEHARQLAHWTEALAGVPPVLELSLDRPRQPMRSAAAAVHRCALPASLLRGVDELARKLKATRFMVLLAGWTAALHRHTGVEDLVLGTTVTGRPRPELERLIGLFVNTVPLRTDLGGDPTFLELIERTRSSALAAFANQDVPFDRIIEALRLPREHGRSPLVQQIFELHDGGGAVRAASLGEVEIVPLAVDSTAAKFDLVATFGPDGKTEGGLLGEIEYATELYDGPSIAAFCDRFRRLLAAAVAAPRTKLSALPLLAAEEQAALIAAAAGPPVAWDAVVPGLTPEMTFPELYALVAARSPEAPAVIDHGMRWSYRELARRAAGVAAGLRALGVGPGAVVPLLADRSPAFLAGMLGTMETGAAFAPLDPKLPEARLAASIAQLGAATVLAGAAYRELAQRLGAQRTGVLDELIEHAPDARDRSAAPAGRPDDVAYVIFTSGSTGTPKGVLVEQRGMINHLIAKVHGLGITAADVVAQNATQSFDVCVWQFLCALLAGGCTTVFADESAWEPAPMLARMARDGVTVLETVPTHMRMVLHELEERGAGAAPLGPLRWFVVNGEPLLPELCARWFRVAPAIPMINAYGPTECSDDVCHFELRGPLTRPWTYVPIDGTLPNLRVHVVDRHFAPVPPGAPGELCVGGIGVGRGYLGDAARTATSFVPDPFASSPSARLYRTGDVVRRWTDGTIEFLGRIDHQVKIRGFRIEIGEIESALSAHPEVRECIVIARADRAAEKRLCAYLVATDARRPPSAKRLADHVRDVLAPYMVPQAFVVLAALPLLPNGKIDRNALPAPSAADLATSSSFVAPRTETEGEVARLWAELLSVEQVGADDNFFELGGHSILALQFLSRIKRALGIELGVRAIFEAQTVAELARRIDAQLAAPAAATAADASPYARLPLAPAPALEEYELAAYQLPEWFMRELAPDSAFYNVDLSGLVFTGALDAAAFLTAWQALIDRHAIFRTTFPRRDGKPMQRVAPRLRLDPAAVMIDRTDVPEERVADEMKAMSSGWARKLFDLEAGPIFRVHLASFRGDRHLFGFAIHHIAWDETSTLTMARELAELYNAARAGRPAALPPAPLAYVDFAHWVNQALQTGVLEAQRQYWLEAFRTPPPALDLPTDFPRPVTPRFEGATVSATLDRALVSRLDARVREHRTTLYVYLLAVVNTLLYRLTGQDDIVVGTPIANRDDERLEGTLGLFATALPIRSRFRDGMSFRQLLEQARATTIEAVDHHHYPSVLAIQEISRGWDSSRSRLFSVMYGTQNDKSRFLDDLRFDGAELGFIADADSPEFDTARFDLTFIVDRIGADTFLHVNYDVALFTGETAQRFLRQALSLVEQTLDDPDRALAALRLLGEAEERALIEASRGPRTDWDARPVPARFREQVVSHPERIAIEDDRVTWSYRQLGERVAAIAAQLTAAGVTPATPVAVTMEPSAELVAALLAVLEVGAAYVPLVPELPAERRAEILARAGAALRIEDDGAQGSAVRATGVAAAAPQAELAYVIFTSGTTGVPKGIAIGHAGLAHLLAATQRAYSLGEDDAVLFATSASFDASILDVFWPLTCGARVVVAAAGEARDPARLLARAQARRATVLQLVPAQLEVLCLTHEAGELPESPLRLLLVGGAALPAALARRFLAALPAVRLVNHYGPTEVTVDALSFDCRGEMVEAVAPIGRPLDDTAAYVVDRFGNLVPPGVKGEVLVASPGLALGYLGDARATAERFVTLAQTGERVYRTGDVARWAADGQLRFVGRLDKQVKVRGNRVELEEVEAHLVSHPLVDRVWCTVDEQEAASRLIAWVQPSRRSFELELAGGVLHAFTLAQRPDLRAAVDRLHMEHWPEWFLGDEVMRRLWPRLLGERADWQFLLVDDQDQLCGVAHAAAICWDGTVGDLPRGWDDALERTFASGGREPDTLVGFAGVIDERVARRGLSMALILGFKTLAARRGLARVALPIRPTGKSEHPEIPFAEWCARRRPDGTAEDAWIRMHERAGGKVLGIEEHSQRVVAPIEEWERWTGRSLRDEAEAHVPGTLGPVRIDHPAGLGIYDEPCLWFDHASEPSLPWQPLDPEQLRQALRAKVPEYMVPDTLRFALQLPSTPSGKLDEQALRELHRQASARPARQVAAPRTALQGDLVALWAEVLGVAVPEVGVDDDFFDLGGHSLAAVRMLAKLKKQLVVAVSLRDFFRARTVARLEELVVKAREAAP
jgi:amino acid adenylation domain-containing protein